MCGGDNSRVQHELRRVQQVAATFSAFAAVLADGSVVTWGDASRGGDSSAVQDQLRNVQQVSASYGAFAAILADGTVVPGENCSPFCHKCNAFTTSTTNWIHIISQWILLSRSVHLISGLEEIFKPLRFLIETGSNFPFTSFHIISQQILWCFFEPFPLFSGLLGPPAVRRWPSPVPRPPRRALRPRHWRGLRRGGGGRLRRGVGRCRVGRRCGRGARAIETWKKVRKRYETCSFFKGFEPFWI